MRLKIVTLIATTTLACGPAKGAARPTLEVVKWTATPATVRPSPDGDRIMDVVLRADVEEGWKFYSLTQKPKAGGSPAAMTVAITPAASLDGSVQGPTPNRSVDPNFSFETETYSGSPVFRFAVKLPANTAAATPVELTVKSQACSDKICLPVRTTTLSVAPPPGST
jgi:thiol:disulfide interchange protein DsbD